LGQLLTLPVDHPITGVNRQNGDGDPQSVLDRWSDYVGGHPIWFASNPEDAYQTLLQVLDGGGQKHVLLPANATNRLIEAVKQSGTKPVFGNLDHTLKLGAHPHVRIVWSQPPLGLPVEADRSAELTVLDHSDSVPRRVLESSPLLWADATIFGLHLSPDPRRTGALVVFQSEELRARFQAAGKKIAPDLYCLAANQLQRLQTIAPRQTSALQMVATGLQMAAGLPILPVSEGVALAHGVALRIPDEGSPSTFWAYASSENTPVQWLPTLRPVHYAAASPPCPTATHLERWLFVPVSPDHDEEINRQAVLGIVKAAEYLGLRWRTDPMRAAQYAALLNRKYGPDHDAYRPAFPIDLKRPAETVFGPGDVPEPSCSI
jgi:hypothetical protein